MSTMLEMFLPKAWLFAQQAGNDDAIRKAVGDQVRRGEAALNIAPASGELGSAALSYILSKRNKNAPGL